MATMSDYRKEAREDAAQMVQDFQDEILDQLLSKGAASDDWNNDYPNGDSYHHETHVDRWYNLQEAAELLDVLSEDEETDSGLWEKQAPRDAISTQAAFTYGNAVWSRARDLIEEINEKAEEILERFDAEADKADRDRDEDGCREALSKMIDEVCK